MGLLRLELGGLSQMLRQFKFLGFNTHLLHHQDQSANVPGMDDPNKDISHQRRLATHEHEVVVEVACVEQAGLDHPRYDN